MESQMQMASQTEDSTVLEAMRSEAMMVSSMNRIHIAACNKDNDKAGASDGGDSRQCLQQQQSSLDELRLKEAEVRDRLEERNSKARKLRREAARRAGVEPHSFCSPRSQLAEPRPASNGYRGRLSIWAPEGFNPLLDLSHLMDECGPATGDSRK